MPKKSIPSREAAEHTTTDLEFPDALNAFEAQVQVTSTASVSLAIHGFLCLLIGVHLAHDGRKDTVQNVLDTLKARVVRVRKSGKDEIKDQMLAVYVRCAHDLFTQVVGKARQNYGGIVSTVATARTIDDALSAITAWLTAEMAGKEKSKPDDMVLSLNALRRYLGHGTGAKDKPSAIGRLTKAVTTARKVIEAGGLSKDDAARVISGLSCPIEIIRANIARLVEAKAVKELEAVTGEADKALETVWAGIAKAKGLAEPAKPAVEAQIEAH